MRTNLKIFFLRNFRKFKRLSLVSWIDTIRINLKLPFRQAIKLPIWLYKSNIDSIKGDIKIQCNTISTGMLRIGLRTSGLHLSNSGISINIKKGGCLIFKGPGYMGNNSAIEIQQNGNIIFGKNFGITSTFKIASRKSITIGDNFSSSWEVNIFDTDFHALYDTNNDIFIDQDDNVYIGNDVWLCQRVTILKGSFIPTRSIIASNSLVNRSFEGMPLNSLYAGLPAKLIKSGLTRKEFRLFEISEMKNIIEYLEL